MPHKFFRQSFGLFDPKLDQHRRSRSMPGRGEGEQVLVRYGGSKADSSYWMEEFVEGDAVFLEAPGEETTESPDTEDYWIGVISAINVNRDCPKFQVLWAYKEEDLQESVWEMVPWKLLPHERCLEVKTAEQADDDPDWQDASMICGRALLAIAERPGVELDELAVEPSIAAFPELRWARYGHAKDPEVGHRLHSLLDRDYDDWTKYVIERTKARNNPRRCEGHPKIVWKEMTGKQKKKERDILDADTSRCKTKMVVAEDVSDTPVAGVHRLLKLVPHILMLLESGNRLGTVTCNNFLETLGELHDIPMRTLFGVVLSGSDDTKPQYQAVKAILGFKKVQKVHKSAEGVRDKILDIKHSWRDWNAEQRDGTKKERRPKQSCAKEKRLAEPTVAKGKRTKQTVDKKDTREPGVPQEERDVPALRPAWEDAADAPTSTETRGAQTKCVKEEPEISCTRQPKEMKGMKQEPENVMFSLPTQPAPNRSEPTDLLQPPPGVEAWRAKPRKTNWNKVDEQEPGNPPAMPEPQGSAQSRGQTPTHFWEWQESEKRVGDGECAPESPVLHRSKKRKKECTFGGGGQEDASMAEWLRQIGIDPCSRTDPTNTKRSSETLLNTFKRNDVDMEALRLLSTEDFEKMGIRTGKRVKIQHALQAEKAALDD
eukprot:TRINITY_DN12678_c0_g1_i6.p1 TRINITY_DN12678_c0_g1~~TRINITY_DN12678_c0_g1_i6.p1  ORF type:complete len:658 (+),score=109.53 TRINITY_DN12678_c0_g1_i6:211-2184(+)